MLNLVRSLYLDGNAFALALRDERFEVESLHLMNPRMSNPVVAETGDVFFRLAGNNVIDRQISGGQLIVPARDVLHIKLHANSRYPHPLVGESPLIAAMTDVAMTDAFVNQQIGFLLNQNRPSAVLSTDLVLDKDQVQQIRDRWNEQSKGLHQGGMPILTAGLKVQPWSTPAKDAQIAELMKLSAERSCWAFRVPLQLLGLGGAPFSSTEALMSFWIATGLDFAINLVEQSFDKLFNLKGDPEEYCEFDSSALLRSAPKDRIEMLVRAVQGGILSPNEARNQEGYDSVEYGDEPRVQQQVVPLSAAGSIPPAPGPASVPTHQEAVQRDLEVLRMRKLSNHHDSFPDAVAGNVIRKVTTRPVKINGRAR
jgi:HK97 family phage portal protein